MSHRSFDTTENAELRAKIDKAKALLPLPDLMRELGYDKKNIGKTALCPFHNDRHASFSVFKNNDGHWLWKCHTGCGAGDEIDFVSKRHGITKREAIWLYLELAGFPAGASATASRECRECHEFREFRE